MSSSTRKSVPGTWSFQFRIQLIFLSYAIQIRVLDLYIVDKTFYDKSIRVPILRFITFYDHFTLRKKKTNTSYNNSPIYPKSIF